MPSWRAVLVEPEQVPDGPRRRRTGVPVSVGSCIVATVQPYEQAVLEAIRACGLELQVVFNKGAVMVLPSGVNKASGLAAALERLALSPHNVVCIGDGENDHALLAHGEVGVAVDNGVTMLKQSADWVTPSANGQGVTTLIDRMVADDLASLDRVTRHDILLGHRADGSPVSIRPHGPSLLIAGTSGGGKSTLANALLERLADQGYQYCVIDPEGDYQDLEGAITLGDGQTPPTEEAMTKLLEHAKQNVVANLMGVRFEDRTAAFLKLFASIIHLRRQYGRPHFLLIDEAHHVLAAAPEAWRALAPGAFDQTCLITLEPDLVAVPALKAINLVIGVGRSTDRTLSNFAKTVGLRDPHWQPIELERGQMVAWDVTAGGAPFVMELAPGRVQQRRHSRKYAEGELGPMRSFFFRGPDAKLNLRAQNLAMFTQIAEGVDDETWLHHLRQGDYSTWFREAIKDSHLGDEAAAVEADERLSAEESRKQIRRLVEKYYTLPGGQGQPPVDEPPVPDAAESLAPGGTS